MFLEINKIINNSNRIVLSTHEKPDADGLGSAIAFYYYLKNLNKEVRIIQPSKYPEDCNIINPDNIVDTFSENDISWIKDSDLVILFDVGNYSRTKNVSEIAIKNNIDIVSIDHHKNDNTDVFKAFIIDVDAPATGLLVWEYLKEQKLMIPWDIKIANALYAALMTDTGSFRYNNTTSNSHIMASELLGYGVKPYDIYVPMYEQRSLSQLRLLSYVIDNTKFNTNNKIAYCALNSNSFIKTKSSIEDVDGFTEFLRSIKGVEVSFLLTEQPDKSYRVNFRSKGKHTVNDIAAKFNGGGHKFAAGCKIVNSNILEIEGKIVNLLDIKMGQ
jgi:bifunctional oligoribonuclease and PAP phosphatase NrnA